MNQETVPSTIAASKSVKWLYCLTLVAMVAPAGILGAFGAVGLATGGGLMGGGPIISVLLVCWVLHRIYRVMRFADTLNAFARGGMAKALRGLGIVLMLVGSAASLLIFFIKPITLSIFGDVDHMGATVFVVGIFTYLFSATGWLGVILFEIGRSTRPLAMRSMK